MIDDVTTEAPSPGLEGAENESWYPKNCVQQRHHQQQLPPHVEENDWENPSVAVASAAAFAPSSSEPPYEFEPEFGGEFGDHIIFQQFRIEAVREAYLRLKEDTGFDMNEHHPDSKMETSDATSAGPAILKPRLPDPKRVTASRSSLPELKEPPLPSAPHMNRMFRDRKTQIAPVISEGTAYKENQVVSPEDRIVQCLGCRAKLVSKRKAMLVSCRSCATTSPAVSTTFEA